MTGVSPIPRWRGRPDRATAPPTLGVPAAERPAGRHIAGRSSSPGCGTERPGRYVLLRETTQAVEHEDALHDRAAAALVGDLVLDPATVVRDLRGVLADEIALLLREGRLVPDVAVGRIDR